MQADTYGWTVVPCSLPHEKFRRASELPANSWGEAFVPLEHDYRAALARYRTEAQLESVAMLLLGFALGYWIASSKKNSAPIPAGQPKEKSESVP